MKTKNTLCGIALALVLLTGGCKEKVKIKRDKRLPEVRENQSLILHPDYLTGKSSLGYTLLTDRDYDGKWDILERIHIGFTPGNYSRGIFFKEGHGPARSIHGFTKSGSVDPEFFEPYH